MRLAFRWLLGLLFTIGLAGLLTQQSTLPAYAGSGRGGNWRVLTVEGGLPSNRVQAIAEAGPDIYGVPGLWIGTDRGLAYFNGRELVTLGSPPSPNQPLAIPGQLPDADILALAVRPDGVLWIGTAGGLARFDHGGTLHQGLSDTTDDTWETFTADNSPLPDDRVQALALSPDGALWVGTPQGAVKLGAETTALLIPGDIRDIAVAEDGTTVWFATAGGVVRFDGRQLDTFTAANSPLAADDVRAVLIDASGTLWIGTSLGISRLTAGGVWLEPLPTDSLPAGPVVDLAVDSQGRVWVALTQDVMRWDGERWRQVVTAFGPPGIDNNLALLAARDDTIWIGTQAGAAGVDGSWESFTVEASGAPDEAANNLVEAVWVEGNIIWAGNSRGVSRSDDGGATWQTATTADGLGEGQVTALWRVAGVLWAGTANGGVSRSTDNGRTWHTASVGADHWDNVVQDLWSDGRTLWAGTAGGVGRSDDGGVTWRMLGDGLTNRNVMALFGEGTVLWAGTQGGWIGRSDDGGLTWRETKVPGLGPEDFVWDVWSDGQTLWAGTSYGVKRSSDGGETWETFARDQGLWSDFAAELWGDGRTLWVGTGYGLSRTDNAGQSWLTFGSGDGLSSDYVSSLWFGEGSLWIGHKGSTLTRYRPAGRPPWLRSGAIFFNGQEYGAARSQTQQETQATRGGIKLLDERNLTVVFSTESGSLMTPQTELRYAYQLVGAEPHLHIVPYSAGLTRHEYVDLPYGSHIFTLEVWDRNSAGSGRQSWPVLVQASPQLTLGDVFVNGTITATTGVLLSDASITAFWADVQGIWVGTEGAGISRSYDQGQTWETITAANGLASDFITALHGRQGVLWASTVESGISYSTDNGQSWHTLTTEQGLPLTLIRALWINEDALWIGAEDAGVARSTDGGKTWMRFTSDDGLASNVVTALWGDGRTIWVGHDYGVSVSRDGGQTWRTFTAATHHLAPQAVLSLWGDGNTLWVGTEGAGVSRTTDGGQTWQTATTANGLGDDSVKSLWSDGQTLWAGTGSWLSYSRDRGVTWQALSPPAGSATDVVYAVWSAGQDVWAGTWQGLWHSTDNGLSWQRVQGTQPLYTVPAGQWESGVTVVFNAMLNDPDSDRPPQLRSVVRAPDGSALAVQAAQDGQSISFSPLFPGFYHLTLSAVDADGNSSPAHEILLNLEETTAVAGPALAWGWALILGMLAALLLYVLAVYLLVSRPYHIPLGAVLNPAQVARFLGGQGSYPQYVEAVSVQGPLEQLLALTLPIKESFGLAQARQVLGDHAVPMNMELLKAALTALVHGRVLAQRQDTYTFLAPNAARIHRRAVGPERVESLARRLRAEHPVYSDALRFFAAAGFDLQELGPTEFLLTAKSPRYRERFGAIYAQIITERVMRSGEVEAMRAAAAAAYGGEVEGRIAFAVVDQTPEAGARFQIYAYRAEAGFTVIPLSHSLLRQALLNERASEVLDSQIRLYLGETDLYAISTPVTDVLSFFGRAKTIDNILALFEQGQHVGLFGLRKMGKTSVIWQLRERLRRQAVAFVDLQASARAVSPLYGQIVQEWARDLQFKYPDLPLPPLATAGRASTDGELVELFRQDFLALRNALSRREADPQLILCLDEIERLLPAPDGTRSGFAGFEEFLATLRGVAQQHGGLRLLVASVDPRLNRTDRWGQIDNPMYRFFQEVFLPPFVPAECAEMVTNIGEQMGVRYTPPALQRIYVESGGHPFLARDLCSLIVRTLPRPVTVDEDAVRAGVVAYLAQPNSYLDSLWEERLSDTEQALLLRLAEQGPMDQEALLATVPDRHAAIQALGRLAESYIVRTDDGVCSVSFGLLQRWMRYQLLGLDMKEA